MNTKSNLSKSNYTLHHKKVLLYVGIVLYILAFVGTFTSPALTYIGYLQLCRRLFIVSILTTFPAMLCLLLAIEIVSEKIKVQLFINYLILSTIFLPIFIRSYIDKWHHYNIFHLIECIVLGTGLILWGCTIKNKRKYFSQLKAWIIENRIVFLIGFIVCICSLEQINQNLRWDSIHYYAYIERLKEFTFNPNDIVLFKASGHASYAYTLIYSIGEAISPGFGYGVRIENIVLFLIAIFLVNEILKITMPLGKKIFRLFTLAIFSVTPVILGPIHNIDVEILTLTLFVAVIYCYHRKLYIIGLLCSIFLVFTKETCILLLVAFILGTFIQSLFINRHSKLGKLFSYDKWRMYITLYLPLIIFIIYFSLDVTWGSSTASENAEAFNTWGINSVVIVSKLKQLFIMNFAWINTVIILIGCIYFIIIKAKKQWQHKLNPIFFVIIVCYFAFLGTQLLYVTYPFPRYLMLQYFFSAIFLQWALNICCIIAMPIRIIICTLCLGVTFIQNFYSLDIVSNKIFSTIDIGNTRVMINSPIAYLNNTTILTGKDAQFLAFSPYADYNRQWSYFDELINKFLSLIGYSQNDLIIYPDTFSPRSANVYFGMWTNTYYDTKEERLKQILNPTLIDANTMIYYNSKIVSENLNLSQYNNVYYLQFSFDPNYSDDILDDYNIIDQITVSYRNWVLNAYKIKE